MRRSRLNLSALRSYRAPQATEPSTLSRGDVLKLSCVAAVGTSPVLKVLGGALNGSFAMKTTRNRVAFSLSGQERWVIDTRRFGGSPRLSVRRSEHSVRVALTGAYYP